MPKPKSKKTETVQNPSTQNLPGEILGISPYVTRSRGPGIRVTYQAKRLVQTKNRVEIQTEIVPFSIDLCDEDTMVVPNLRLAIQTLAGVSDAYEILTSYVFKKLDPSLRGKR